MKKQAFALLSAVLILGGCSSKDMRPQAQTVSSGAGPNDITATMTPTPDPPRTGENDLLIRLATSGGAPIVDADMTVTATTTLTGATGNTQTGKTNGDGTYHVDKLILPVTEVYTIKVAIQRIGKPEVDLKFKLSPQ